MSAGTEGADDDYELAGIASVSRGFDAGNPRGTKGRLPSPVLATA